MGDLVHSREKQLLDLTYGEVQYMFETILLFVRYLRVCVEDKMKLY